ncbi:MAG: hypothetical protein Q4B26_17850 [Eubacteriales bacterium]|nr:hypothetical protein [Eubacteriales bacterium]
MSNVYELIAETREAIEDAAEFSEQLEWKNQMEQAMAVGDMEAAEFYEKKLQESSFQEEVQKEKEELPMPEATGGIASSEISFLGRSRSSIEADLHEAKSKVDYNNKRYAELIRDDPTQINAIGGYERAAKSWGYRVEKLEEELRKCED